MTNANEKLLIYFDDEEHLVRRLGAAVISCWRELPNATQDRLIQQAKRVVDVEDSEGLDEQIRRFITDHDESR